MRNIIDRKFWSLPKKAPTHVINKFRSLRKKISNVRFLSLSENDINKNLFLLSPIQFIQPLEINTDFSHAALTFESCFKITPKYYRSRNKCIYLAIIAEKLYTIFLLSNEKRK